VLCFSTHHFQLIIFLNHHSFFSMKRFSSFSLVAAFVVGAAFASTATAFAQTKQTQEAPQAAPATASEPQKTAPTPGAMAKARAYRVANKAIKGVVVNLHEYFATGNGKVNAAQATEATGKGITLGFLVGSGRSAKVYHVAKTDGSSAQADLARMADMPVAIIGKMASRGGAMVIMADVMDNSK
jgi:hypothetical protein